MLTNAVLKYKDTELPIERFEFLTENKGTISLTQETYDRLMTELGYKVVEPLTLICGGKPTNAICTGISSGGNGYLSLDVSTVEQDYMRLPRSAKKAKADPINPDHYKGNVECIDALEAILGRNGVEDYCNGCAIKYLWRWRKKNGLEDLKKAQWYINRLIAYVQEDYEGLKNGLSSMLESNEPATKD